VSDDAWSERTGALARRIAAAFEALAHALELPPDALERRPGPGAWSPLEVVEHVTLTNRSLGLLIDKIARRSRARLADGGQPAAQPGPVEHLRELGSRGLGWRQPEHLSPAGETPRAELSARLDEQAADFRALLEELAHGEGTRHTIRMSAVEGGDDRLDLYQFLEVVALHAERHLRQIERGQERDLEREEDREETR
jgi:hypothetical protein